MKRQIFGIVFLLVACFGLTFSAFGQAMDKCNVYVSPGNPYPCCDNDGGGYLGTKDGNCTWWAWKRAKEVWGSMPINSSGNYVSWGSAGVWATNARNSGYQVLTSPAPESVGVRTTGHVVWVTTVNTDGTIGTTEMNCGYPNLAQGGPKQYISTYFNGGFIFPPARITSIPLIDPYRSSVDRDVTVWGDGFAPKLTVQVTFPNGGQATLSGAQIMYVTRTRFVMRVKLNATGAWRFRVINPQGGTGSQSNLFSIYVY